MPPIRSHAANLGKLGGTAGQLACRRVALIGGLVLWLISAGGLAQSVRALETLAPVVQADLVRATARARRQPRVAAVVCAPEMLTALEPWKRRRLSQGIRMVHVDSRLPTTEIRRVLQGLAENQPLRYVVLVGDANAQMAYRPQLRAASVPTFYYEASIIKKWGPETVIATDNPFGDLDGDGVPELAVGRLTADNPLELSQIVEKILFYESLPATGTWRRRVQLTAGAGDFGAITDAIVETAAKRFVTDGIPADYRVTLAYGSWRSPYCPDPRAFRECVLGSVREGCLFWVYLGHGRPCRLDRIRIGESVLPILEPTDVGRLQSESGLPIAVLMACYTGAFDQPVDCLAERMLRTPRGPVAVVCGTRVTMPYAMAVLGTALMDGYFERRYDRLGDILLFAKQQLAAKANREDRRRQLLDTLALALNPAKHELLGERTEHQLIFHLLGDPTLQLRYPETVQLSCGAAIESGQTLEIRGHAPLGGECLLELCCRRDGYTFTPPKRRVPASSDEDLVEMSHIYRQSNDRLWNSTQVRLQPGPFVVELPVPRRARGFSQLRAFVQGSDGYAMGSTSVYIRSADTTGDLRQSNAVRR